MEYKTTKVKVNNTYKEITAGTAVIKNGVKYIFQWCTYQFEVWRDTSINWYHSVNFEGGIGEVDAIIE